MEYRDAGVRLEAAEEATRRIRAALRTALTPEVLAGVGAFAGALDADRLKSYAHPVLLASTDGVGTKTLLAVRAGRLRGLGHDLVNHGVDDLLAAGGWPLFFLDYLAADRLNPQAVAELVEGVAEAARAAGMPVLGGETAEMPGVYRRGAVDLAGTIVGVAERSELPDPSRVRPGDRILALPSSGPHTNGYSLIRRVIGDRDLFAPCPELGGASLADRLLAPHRSYLPEWRRLRAAELLPKVAAHITGGGVYGNLPRVLPPGLGAVLRRGSWSEPPVFAFLKNLGGIPDREMFAVFNMGLGMLLVYDPASAEQVLGLVDEAQAVGEVVEGQGVVVEGVDG